LRHGVIHGRNNAEPAVEQSENGDKDKKGWRDPGKGSGSIEGNYVNWMTFSDNAKSVVQDVARIRNHPLVRGDIPIYGYIYDVKSGQLVEVPEAMKVGKAR